jgi:hypothetical protein
MRWEWGFDISGVYPIWRIWLNRRRSVKTGFKTSQGDGPGSPREGRSVVAMASLLVQSLESECNTDHGDTNSASSWRINTRGREASCWSLS